MKTALTFRIYAVILLAITLGGLYLLSPWPWGTPDPLFPVYLVLLLLVRLYSFNVGPRLMVSLAFPVSIFLVWNYGLGWGLVASWISYLIMSVFEEKEGLSWGEIQTILAFNLGMEGAYLGLASGLLRFWTADPALDVGLGPLVGSYCLAKIANELILGVGYVARKRPVENLLPGLSRDFLQEGLLFPLATTLFFLHRHAPLWATLLFVALCFLGSLLAQRLSLMGKTLQSRSDDLENRVKELTALEGAARKISSQMDEESVCRVAYDAARGILDCQNFAIALKDRGQKTVSTRFLIGQGERQPDVWQAENTGLTGWILRMGQPLRFGNIQNEISGHPAVPSTGDGIAALSWLGVPIEIRDEVVGVLFVQSPKPNQYTEHHQRLLLTLAAQTGGALRTLNLGRQVQETFLQTLATVADFLDAKDPYTAGHSRRVGWLSKMMAESMELPKDQIQDIYLAGILHDIGKIGLRDSILLKPGKLNLSELKEVQRHPAVGAHILERIPRMKGALQGIRHHHEFWNGDGYPDGLTGENIPLLARIISIADAFDTMTSERVYREKRTTALALAELVNCSGTQFDPTLVEIFCSLAENRPRDFRNIPDVLVELV